MCKKTLGLASLLTLISCYDYGFKEVQVRGQVYFVKSEGYPDHYTLEFKESETNYKPLITNKILAVEDSGTAIYVATAQIPPQFYKINPERANAVALISEKEFVTFFKSCKHCRHITVPQH